MKPIFHRETFGRVLLKRIFQAITSERKASLAADSPPTFAAEAELEAGRLEPAEEMKVFLFQPFATGGAIIT